MGKLRTAYGLAIVIFAIDQISKFIMIGPLALEQRGQIILLPIFNFTWVENRGISLGFAQASSDTQRWLLIAGTAIIAGIVAWWIRKEEKSGERIALALVLGGALGNIVDRVRLGFVVDFLDLHFGEWRPFLVFNVADAAISIGVVILLLRAIFIRPAAPEEKIDHA
ncbi:signal peptidase II [Sphingomonas sp.]|uniref:signal peptidase II n=1 Tax=Sphingomonas sp. TaxID=28214 RepID=UPI00286BCE13|nr:signal peptidase II [Sphingomonas sp.]